MRRRKTVTIANFEFAPDTLEVRVVDTITVDNKDQTEHTVSAQDKSFDTGSFPGTKDVHRHQGGQLHLRL